MADGRHFIAATLDAAMADTGVLMNADDLPQPIAAKVARGFFWWAC
jgi:hypothetical protein